MLAHWREAPTAPQLLNREPERSGLGALTVAPTEDVSPLANALSFEAEDQIGLMRASRSRIVATFRRKNDAPVRRDFGGAAKHFLLERS